MRKKLLYTIMALGALVTAASCEKEIELDTPLYPVEEEDLASLKVYIQEKATNNTHTTAYDSNPTGLILPEDDTLSFYVRLSHAAEEEIKVNPVLEGLPEGTYAFVDGHAQAVIKPGERVSEEDIRIVLVENDALIGLDEYTTAKITLDVVSGPAEVGQNLNTFTWTVRNRYSIIYLGTIEGLQEKQYVGGVDWTPYSTSSYVDRFYDGDYSSYIYLTASPNNTTPQMYVDLNSKAMLEGIGFVPYGSSVTYLTRYWPGEAEFYISNNGENWKSVGVIEFEPGEAATWQVIRFYEPTEARFIGCKFNRNMASYYSSIYFSEVGIFGDLSVREVYVTPDEAYVRVGKTISLSAAQRPVNSPDQLTLSWSSSNPSVATVDAEGNVTGVAPGVVTITAAGGGFEGAATVIVRENKEPEFFGNYTMYAPTGAGSTYEPTARKIEILQADDSHVTWRFTDAAQMRVINDKETWLIATLPYEKIDGDHYRVIWPAGTLFATDFLTASGLAAPKVYACMYRGSGTSTTYRSIADTSVDLEFIYDEALGTFSVSYGDTHDWSYDCTGIGLAYDYINASGREYTNQSWLVMWGGEKFSMYRD